MKRTVSHTAEILILLLQPGELGGVFGIVYIHNGHPLRFSRASAPVFHSSRIIPVPFDTVIHMIREADFRQSECDRVSDDLLHRILGIVTVFSMNVIICKHNILPFFDQIFCFADQYFTLSKRVITGFSSPGDSGTSIFAIVPSIVSLCQL